MIIHLIAGLKKQCRDDSTSTKPHERSGENVKAELNLSNYATKANLKGATGIKRCMFASKTDLASLKTKVDDVDGDKTKTVPVNLGKLSNAVNNGVVKKPLYNQLVTKVNAIDTKTPSTSRLVTKRRYDSDKHALEKKIEDGYKKIPNTSRLVK